VHFRAQYYLTQEDIGKPRAAASLQRLASLNPYVPLHHITGPLTDDVLRRYKAVVCTQVPLSEQVRINNVCHAAGTYFISAETRGVFGYRASTAFFIGPVCVTVANATSLRFALS